MSTDRTRRLMDINELANYLSLKCQTIRNKLSNGSFPIAPKKLGGALRWDIREVDQFLDKLEPVTKSSKVR